MLGVVAACDALGAPSKVREGALYVSGSARYDAYFSEIHAQQVAAAAWPAERKRTRKPLADVLKLAAEADDPTLIQTTRDRMSGGALRLDMQGTEARIVPVSAGRRDDPHDLIIGVEQTAQAEMARAKRLAELPTQLDELAKAGHALEAHIRDSFGGSGQKLFDVREELYVSYDALQAIARTTRRERQVAEQFVADLGRAVSTGTEAPTPPLGPQPKEKPGRSSVPPKSPSPDEAAKPARAARTEPASLPRPLSPQAATKPAEHTEVFSP